MRFEPSKLLMSAAAASISFSPPGSAGIVENQDASWAFQRLRSVPVSVPGVGEVSTSFFSQRSVAASDEPTTVLFLHGGDSTCVEWAQAVRRLTANDALNINCVAPDWWTGGWTARAPITAAVEGGALPWDCIREHLHAFWQSELGGRPVLLVGTSMGGAVALDFATSHPEAVSKMVLIDAGGESYAAPPPLVGKFLAPFCPNILRLLAWVLPRVGGEAGLLASLHRNEPGWKEAYVAYLGSGGYELRVGPERIRGVQQETLVVWGSDDKVLDPKDADAFRRDLKHCAGVRLVAGAGHCPHNEKPDATAEILAGFLGG